MHRNNQTHADNQNIKFLNEIRIDWHNLFTEHDDRIRLMANEPNTCFTGWCPSHWKSLESFQPLIAYVIRILCVNWRNCAVLRWYSSNQLNNQSIMPIKYASISLAVSRLVKGCECWVFHHWLIMWYTCSIYICALEMLNADIQSIVQTSHLFQSNIGQHYLMDEVVVIGSHWPYFNHWSYTWYRLRIPICEGAL